MHTFPSSPPAAVAVDLAAPRTALDQSRIAPKSVDRNVLIATWNIRGFGKVLNKWELALGDSRRRSPRDVLCLASIISRVDVVALQEVVRQPQRCLVPDTTAALRGHGRQLRLRACP